jgi:hypothetical protein
MDTIRSVTPNASANGAVVANSPAPARTPALPATQRVNPANAPVAAGSSPVPLRRGLAAWGNQLQDEVARAQQALDYLDRLQEQLETVKGDLAARLSGSRGGARQLEARIRQLGATLDGRSKSAGDGVSNQLEFSAAAPASQRFRIRGLDTGTLQAVGAQTLKFSIAGSPQLSVAIDPSMTPEEIAARFDRALAPANVRVSLDNEGQLVFSTPESNWPAVREGITLIGRGRVTTDEEPASLSPQDLEIGNVDALRQSLREVVQALARVRRSQEAASAALSAAINRTATAHLPPPAEVQAMAQDFAQTASSPDYNSLIAITSALVGVSRERVLALLGHR